MGNPRIFWTLLAALWLASLPLRPLFDPDEGRYAEIPREMAASGDWVTPTLNGLKYFEKPPLQYWATASIYSVFGVHEWTARAWAASLAFLCIPLVFAFARRIGYSTESALVSSALLAINPYFALTGQLNLLDQGFSFFLSAALFSFVVAQVEAPQPSRSRGWMVITWAALALAVLSKGIVALVLAGATVVAYLAFTRDFALLRRLNIVAGLPLFLLLTIPWFWLIQQRNPEFFQFFFIREHFERFLTTVHARTGPPWYFVPLVLLALLPLIGNWKRWRLEKIESGRAAGDFRPELFLLLWCAVVVVFFSLSESKLASYIMPIMPALAVILGRVTQEDPRAHSRAKWISVGLLVLLGTVLVAIGGYRKTWASGPALAWGSVLVVSCLAYLVFDRLRNDLSTTQRWAALSAVSIVGYQLLAMCYASSFPSRSASGLASEFAGGIPADTDLYSVGQYRHSLVFYLRRPLAVYDYTGELEFGMHQARLTAEGQDRQRFLEQWQKEGKAVAFIDPHVYPLLNAAGMEGHVVAQDSHSIAVARR